MPALAVKTTEPLFDQAVKAVRAKSVFDTCGINIETLKIKMFKRMSLNYEQRKRRRRLNKII